jgi:hypothetical protein
MSILIYLYLGKDIFYILLLDVAELGESGTVLSQNQLQVSYRGTPSHNSQVTGNG